jgi:hypothetical protein
MQRTGKAGRGRGAQAPLDPSGEIVTVDLTLRDRAAERSNPTAARAA